MSEVSNPPKVEINQFYHAIVSAWAGSFPHVTLAVKLNANWPEEFGMTFTMERAQALKLAEAIRSEAERIPIPEIEPAPPPSPVDFDQDDTIPF